jgi:hypothetical protein
MKLLCPNCKTPQRFIRRRQAFKLHQRGTGVFRTVPAVLNKDLEPTLRSSGNKNDVGIESYQRELLEWCHAPSDIATPLADATPHL